MAISVTTGEVRLSYVNVFTPYAHNEGSEPKYSVTVLLPKSDTETYKRIQDALNSAIDEGVSTKWGGVKPAKINIPIHDGDGERPSDGEPFGEECKGHWVFTASAKAEYPPEIVDKNCNPIINQSEVYSGMYGRVNVSFFAYNFSGKKGIGCGLGPIQKLRDGEPLANRPTAASVFGEPKTARIDPFTGLPL